MEGSRRDFSSEKQVVDGEEGENIQKRMYVEKFE